MNSEGHAEQEDKLLEKLNKVRNRLLRNKLVLASVLNFVTFAAFFFVMGFYGWVWLHLKFEEEGSLVLEKQGEVDLMIWVNLLFLKQDAPGAKYISYANFSEKHCQMNTQCENVLGQIQFYGRVCFLTFVIAGSLQLYDFGKTVYAVWKATPSIESKNSFRHLVIVFTYVLGLTLSSLSILMINPTEYRLGVSFWIGVITLGLLTIIAIYEQLEYRKIQKQALILDLLQKQQQIRSQQIKNNNEIQLEVKAPSNQQGFSL